jgi:hypothetical protein
MVRMPRAGGIVLRSLGLVVLSSLLAGCAALGPPPSAPPTGTHAPAATLPPAWTPTGGARALTGGVPGEVGPTSTAAPSFFHVASVEETRQAIRAGSVPLLNRIMAEDNTLAMPEPEPLLWYGSWCASNREIMEQNFTVMETLLYASGFEIDPGSYATVDYGSGEAGNTTFCRGTYVLIDSWPYGMTFLEVRHVIHEALSDGWDNHQPDTIVTRFVVLVGEPF